VVREAETEMRKEREEERKRGREKERGNERKGDSLSSHLCGKKNRLLLAFQRCRLQESLILNG
jgi:hypothetical protein